MVGAEEEEAEMEETEGAEIKMGLKPPNILLQTQDTKPPATLTCPHLGCANGTGSSENQVSRALSPTPVNGKILYSQDNNRIEGLTNS